MQLAGLGARDHVGPFAQHQLEIGPGQRVDACDQIGLDADGAAVALAPDEGAPAGVAAEQNTGVRGQPVALGLGQLDTLGRGRLGQGQPTQQRQHNSKYFHGMLVVRVTEPAGLPWQPER